jgi:hypothetical protein
MDLYEIKTAVTYRTDEGLREQSTRTVIYCQSDADAKLAGLLYVARQAEYSKGFLDDPQIGSVKVYQFRPARFENGKFASDFSTSSEIFEWKCDWYPYDLELEFIRKEGDR